MTHIGKNLRDLSDVQLEDLIRSVPIALQILATPFRPDKPPTLSDFLQRMWRYQELTELLIAASLTRLGRRIENDPIDLSSPGGEKFRRSVRREIRLWKSRSSQRPR